MSENSQRTDNKTPNADDEEQDDYIDEAHPDMGREDAIVDEQGEESFPASDPPANY